jgi:hypothetical protein
MRGCRHRLCLCRRFCGDAAGPGVPRVAGPAVGLGYVVSLLDFALNFRVGVVTTGLRIRR